MKGGGGGVGYKVFCEQRSAIIIYGVNREMTVFFHVKN